MTAAMPQTADQVTKPVSCQKCAHVVRPSLVFRAANYLTYNDVLPPPVCAGFGNGIRTKRDKHLETDEGILRTVVIRLAPSGKATTRIVSKGKPLSCKDANFDGQCPNFERKNLRFLPQTLKLLIIG
ncbi:MAG: hypothetical protein WC612_06200 [Bdellovibrionales bacterium]|jgi:hypothetical protein